MPARSEISTVLGWYRPSPNSSTMRVEHGLPVPGAPLASSVDLAHGGNLTL